MGWWKQKDLLKRKYGMAKTNPLDYLLVLQEEIAYQKSQLQPHDTGHIHTTIGVLEQRVSELEDKIRADIYSSQGK